MAFPIRCASSTWVESRLTPISCVASTPKRRFGASTTCTGRPRTRSYSSYAVLDPTAPDTPIGRPTGNSRIYVLDERWEPVPVGVVGELFLGGEGVARGYVGRPALTAERFLPDPFGAPGSRMYRSGDLGRYGNDGKLRFVGRCDNQVKIRGYRVELGEIEAAICEHDLIEDAVVVTHGAGEQKKLVAYVVERRPQAANAGELVSFLRARLPRFMIPSLYVALESVPLLPNGKIDRRRLPAPDPSPANGQAFMRARTPTEERVAAVWSEVLED